jgi:hypothetical protein
VIEEVGSTTLIFPGDVGYVDAYSNIRIEIQSEGVGDARD